MSSCEQCKYYRGGGMFEHSGDCRRRSPVFVAPYERAFPHVHKSEWCGEYEWYPPAPRAELETSVGNPLAAVRWICSDCNIVNGIDRTNCNGCQLSRELSEKHFAVNTSAMQGSFGVHASTSGATHKGVVDEPCSIKPGDNNA